jgi:tRNA-intron endonuclease, archaea type
MKAKKKATTTKKKIVKETPAEKKVKKDDLAESQESKAPCITATFMDERVVTENSDAGRLLYEQSRFGKISAQKVVLSLIEAFYLLEKGKLEVHDKRNKPLPEEVFIKKAQKIEPKFWVKYCVFKDLRNRGYIVKTALKFGADFRVYDRGVKPGEDHAKWIVYPAHEGSTLTWHEFSAKNRVAHSTKKRLLMGIVDGEESVTYYEIRWLRP